VSESSQNGPLAAFERRWGDERSPQLTLQLAEEHRSRGDIARAVEVLRQGLEYHPSHVAARVALGRFLFEDGQTVAAIAALESVVDDDPTHLVANKILVSACLEVGDRERARNRLGLYKLLNAADADIEALEQRVEGVGTAATEHTPDSPAQENVGEPGAVAESEQLEPSFEASAEHGATEMRVRTAADPFGDVWSVPDHLDYQSALAAEGIFQIADVVTAGELGQAAAQAEEPGEAPSEAPAGATVTLGRLYLDQGHVEEAERIFRAVLELDPDNVDAQVGLQEALGVGAELKATDLVDAEMLAMVEPVERKRLVLKSYRSRLRAGSAEG
jgi:tetratricopeptide (TPR) repeat protein